MPVTYDNAATAFALGSSINFSFTVTGTDPALIVFINEDSNSVGGTVTGVTYNGVGLSDIGSSAPIRVFAKQGVSTGSNTLSISRSSYGNLGYNMASFAGVDSTTPFGTVVHNTATNSTATTGSVTCPTDGMVFGAEFSPYTSSPAPTINSGTLTIATRSAGSGQTLAGGYRSTTGSVAWNLASSTTWRAAGTPINPMAGGGGAISVNLTGTSITISQGNEIASISYGISGISNTTSTGSIRSAASYGLSGQSVTTAAGTIRSAISRTITGSSVTVSTGSVSTGSDVSKTLSGIALAVNQGTTTAAISRGITGQSSSFASGTIVNTVGPTLNGASLTTASGTLRSALSRTLSGSSVTVTPGNVSSLSGTYVTVKAGSWIRYRTI